MTKSKKTMKTNKETTGEGFIDLTAASEAQHEAWPKTTTKETTAERIANHPMHSLSDLKYLRKKGYSDQEILAFWDRDHGMGHKPVQHRFTYTGTAGEVVPEVLRDNLSPQTIAAIAAHLFAASTKNDGVNKEIRWLADQLVSMVGTDQYNALCEEVGL